MFTNLCLVLLFLLASSLDPTKREVPEKVGHFADGVTNLAQLYVLYSHEHALSTNDSTRYIRAL